MVHRSIRVVALILTGLMMSRLGMASETIIFHFKHEESNAQTQLYFLLTKGAHKTETNSLVPGETETGSTTNSWFAPTPSGLYYLRMFCFKYRIAGDDLFSMVERTFTVEPHSKPIHIQARCPDVLVNNQLAPADNIHIDVEK